MKDKLQEVSTTCAVYFLPPWSEGEYLGGKKRKTPGTKVYPHRSKGYSEEKPLEYIYSSLQF